MANPVGFLTTITLQNGNKYIVIGVPYGVCSTTNSTQNKAVTIDGITALFEGLSIRIKFSNAQTYNGNPKLNLNNLGAKSIKRNGSIYATQYEWSDGEILDLVYDGESWIIVNGGALKIG